MSDKRRQHWDIVESNIVCNRIYVSACYFLEWLLQFACLSEWKASHKVNAKKYADMLKNLQWRTKIISKVNFPLEQTHTVDNETVSRRLLSFAFTSVLPNFISPSVETFFFHSPPSYGLKEAEEEKSKQTRVICLLQFYEPKTFCLFHDVRIRN